MKSKLSIIITNEAKNDINGIVAYISLDNKVAGLNFAKYLKMMFVYMLEFPNIGRKRPEYTDEDVLFFTIKWGYNIVYYVKNDKIYILRALSEYQDCNFVF